MTIFVYDTDAGPLRVQGASKAEALVAIRRQMIYDRIPGPFPLLDAIREEASA